MSINKTLRTIGGLRVITVCLPVGPARKRDSIKLRPIENLNIQFSKLQHYQRVVIILQGKKKKKHEEK